MGKLTKNYIYTTIYQLLVLLAPIITAPYLARVLGADNMGIYSYVNSAGNVITMISLLGVYAYGNRQTAYVRDDKIMLTKNFWEIEIVRLFLGTLGTVIYVLYAVLDKKYTVFFLIYYPYILSQFIDCSWLFVGLEDMKTTTIKNCLTKIANVIGIFVFVKTREDVWKYILLLALTSLMANISMYTQVQRYIGSPMVDLKKVPKHIFESVHLFLPKFASVLYLQVDKIMLQWMTGTTSQVSFYDQAEKIVLIPLSIITAINSVTMPRIANEYKKNNLKTIETLLLKAGNVAICLAMPMMIGIMCVAKKFIPWYLGHEFISTSTAMMILAPIIILNTLAGISGAQFFTATNQVGILVKAYATAAIMNVVVNYILIPGYGYIGTAFATVISSFISVVIQYKYILQQVRIQSLFASCLRYLCGAVIMAAIILICTSHLKATATTTFVQIILGGFVYVMYLILIKDEVLLNIKERFVNFYNNK